MELDRNKIEEAVSAPGALGRHDGERAQTPFDWDSMRRLHEKGALTDLVGMARSVLYTDDGARESLRLLQSLPGEQTGRDPQ